MTRTRDATPIPNAAAADRTIGSYEAFAATYDTLATRAFVGMQAQRGKRAELLNVITDELGGPYDGILAMCVLIHVGFDHTDAVQSAGLRVDWHEHHVYSDGDAWLTYLATRIR